MNKMLSEKNLWAGEPCKKGKETSSNPKNGSIVRQYIVGSNGQ
jgi:hypothetical protein